MNDITRMNENELSLNISGRAGSWHDDYKNNPHIFIGNIAPDVSQEELLIIFSQYGEIDDINIIKDRNTNTRKPFCFLTYFDYRSAILAIDNLNMLELKGKNLRVDHASNESYNPSKYGRKIPDLFKDCSS
eukprot:TRINITY_DN584_c0_g1_i1.p1 TRINITY_DN584_c0_g1~~TRINITY_DN584_c0_g1_i1.p1  ORF type:complete len:131 (+),score=25.18 TRINITY_DN584_c0_g1_i1:52-444(+)